MKDFYDILGVEPGASSDEIKRIYHKLSKKYHPDANISDPDLLKWSETRMKELNEAYDTLKDPVKRAFYDRQRGQARPQPSPPTAGTNSSPFTQFHQSIVVRSTATNALIFGLFGLLRGGIPFAISGAVIGAMIGAIIGNMQIKGLPPGATQGFLLGMFLGAMLLKPPLMGILVGGVIGAIGGWYLLSRGQKSS